MFFVNCCALTSLVSRIMKNINIFNSENYKQGEHRPLELILFFSKCRKRSRKRSEINLKKPKNQHFTFFSWSSLILLRLDCRGGSLKVLGVFGGDFKKVFFPFTKVRSILNQLFRFFFTLKTAAHCSTRCANKCGGSLFFFHM